MLCGGPWRCVRMATWLPGMIASQPGFVLKIKETDPFPDQWKICAIGSYTAQQALASSVSVLPIVPLITSRPASLPVSSAQKASRFVVVGSSCMTSSSRVVAEIASSMRVVGVVTVSPVSALVYVCHWHIDSSHLLRKSNADCPGVDQLLTATPEPLVAWRASALIFSVSSAAGILLVLL